MYVIGYETYLRKPTNDGVYSDIMPGDNVDVEFGSFNGQLFIKNIKRKDA